MRIGFIAMSGVRACDPDLLELGLTLPGFVERGKTIASLPSLGLLTLAGLTPAGHSIEYLEIDDLRHLTVLPDRFDLVVISSFSAQIFEAYELADRFRAHGVRVVLGGLHVTVLPDEAAQHADAVVVGEGEPVWPAVIDDAVAGRLQPRYVSDGQYSLENSPLPRFDLLEIDRYNRLTVQTSRGCPLRCEFCASSILLTPRYKLKPVAKVLAEIDRIRALWRRPFLEFADDNSFVHRGYWKELLGELRTRGLRWFTECDLRVYEDDELLDLMHASGCAEVLIGLESPIEAGLSGLELKSDWKHRRWSEYREAIRRIQSRGIRVNGCFILGLDGQTSEVFDAVYDFARDAELYDVQITLQTPFPGTPLYDRLKNSGRLLHDGQWNRCTLFDINFVPDSMSIEELRSGFYHLARRLYAEDISHWRRDNFNRKYLRSKLHPKGSLA
ncbi:MAG: radical SAM protein [Planctomycetales bacterium]